MFKNKKLIGLVIAVIIAIAVPVLSVYYDGMFTNLLIKGFVDMPELSSAPGTPDSTVARMYAYSNEVYLKDDAGKAVPLIARGFNLPLAAAFIDGTGVIGNDGTTAPGLAEHDNIPAIVYASSAEATPVKWTFRVPPNYVSGLTFKMMISSSDASGANQSIDWQLWSNTTATSFDASATAQDAVAATSATLDASNEVLTFTLDATGEALMTAGNIITVDFWNAGTSDGTTEIKNLDVVY